MRQAGTRRWVAALLAAAVLGAWPEVALACETCFGGGVDTPTTRGIALAMMALLGITAFIGVGIVSFFVRTSRRARALAPGETIVTESGDLVRRDEAADGRSDPLRGA